MSSGLQHSLDTVEELVRSLQHVSDSRLRFESPERSGVALAMGNQRASAAFSPPIRFTSPLNSHRAFNSSPPKTMQWSQPDSTKQVAHVAIHAERQLVADRSSAHQYSPRLKIDNEFDSASMADSAIDAINNISLHLDDLDAETENERGVYDSIITTLQQRLMASEAENERLAASMSACVAELGLPISTCLQVDGPKHVRRTVDSKVHESVEIAKRPLQDELLVLKGHLSAQEKIIEQLRHDVVRVEQAARQAGDKSRKLMHSLKRKEKEDRLIEALNEIEKASQLRRQALHQD